MDQTHPILVTGAAGFIGFHLCRRLLTDGHPVLGVDNLSEYYDVDLKRARLKQLETYPDFRFLLLDLAQRGAAKRFFEEHEFDILVHLAAQAGVRYSLQNPHAYGDSNLLGFLNILEGCRRKQVKHLVFASSSSVYGANSKMPFSVHDNVDHPMSLYAASKKANELMAHTYAHLYGLPCTGLRFFTVYGPWGRPDMALFIFTRAILAGEPIKVFNYGNMRRDFTYIDDIVEGVVRVMGGVPRPHPDWCGAAPDPGSSFAPYRIYNIGSNRPVDLMEFISILEGCLERAARKELLPMQPGDVPETYADIEDLTRDFGFLPSTPLRDGVRNFVQWYKEYYRIESKG
jgi:UDP-glucuronate 4-epimerase